MNKIFYKLEIYLDKTLIADMIKGLNDLGACSYDAYDHVATYYQVAGCFRPSKDANPYSGSLHMINYGKEYKLEVRCEEKYVKDALKYIRQVHPYEEAVVHVIRLDNHLFE